MLRLLISLWAHFLLEIIPRSGSFCIVQDLEFGEKGKTDIMEEIVAKALTNSYHKRLAYLEGKNIITLVEYAKVNKISHSNLINKANRQTIEAFLERGVWKIGVESKSI